MIPTFSNDCPQSMFDSWWVEDKSKTLCRGRLLWAYVPHVDQEPLVLIPKGRETATVHTQAECEIAPLDIRHPASGVALPVAGLPSCNQGEVRTVYKAKKRPVLLLVMAGEAVPKGLTQGYPRYQTSPTFLVAPYYGINQNGLRAGWSPELVAIVRQMKYWQFFWDKLPLDSSTESILRLDHIQPIGTMFRTFETTDYRLGNEAMLLMDELVEWAIWKRYERFDFCGKCDPFNGQILLPLVRETMEKIETITDNK